MTDVLEKLRLLFRPKTNPTLVCANCMSRRTWAKPVLGTSKHLRVVHCDDCGHTWVYKK